MLFQAVPHGAVDKYVVLSIEILRIVSANYTFRPIKKNLMARRNDGILDLLAALPWYMSIIATAVAYFTMIYAFIFKDDELIACVELVGYVLGEINEVQSHKMVAPFTFNIDLEKSTQIHTRQPHPHTLIEKKIQGERQYDRFDSQELILLIHTEVYVKNNVLFFAMDGMMQLNPSVNNFLHHKKEIIHELRSISQDSRSDQWDRIVLLDYTHSSVIDQCPVLNISG